MIEQTELIVTKCLYHRPRSRMEEEPKKLSGFISFDVIKKRHQQRKELLAASPLVSFLTMKQYWNVWEKIHK